MTTSLVETKHEISRKTAVDKALCERGTTSIKNVSFIYEISESRKGIAKTR